MISVLRVKAQAAQTQMVQALVSNGGTLTSFGQAANLPLFTDQDFARFVDPQVTGANRTLAIALLRWMPANMRADFTYVESNGSVLSNRAGLGFNIRRIPPSLAANLHLQGSRRMANARSGLRSSLAVAPRRPFSYPPNGGVGGAYIRTYSQQNINAMYGYAIPPCDVSLLSNESGNMYFNAYDSNGDDVVDAGIGTNINSGTYGNGESVPFINAYGTGYLNSGWTNQTQTYGCGTPVGLLYGTLAPPNGNMSVLFTGVPDYDPTQLGLPPATTLWSNGAWNFFNTNPSLYQSNQGSWDGIPSNCTGCSVGRMVTIGQNGVASPVLDGSCYGYCPGSPSTGGDAYWYETVAGQLIAPCENDGSSAQCTIEDSASWVSNVNSSLNIGTAYDAPNDQAAAEGLNLNSSVGDSSATRRSLPPSLPASPASACPPDSDGLCAYPISTTANGKNCTNTAGPHPVYDTGSTKTYYIFKGSKPAELMSTATYTTSFKANGTACVGASIWSPSNPAAQYNDPSLP